MKAVDAICERPDDVSAVEAAIKVASELDLLPGHIELVCRAVNTSQINHTRSTGNSLSEKLAACELLNADEIISAVYPADSPVVKTAIESVVSPIYSGQSEGEFSKAASSDECKDCEEASESEESEDDDDDDGDDDDAGDSKKSDNKKKVKKITVVSMGVDPLAGLLPMGLPAKIAEARKLSAELRNRRNEITAKERTAFVKIAEAVDAFRYDLGNDPGILPWMHEVMTHRQGEPGGHVVDIVAGEVLSKKQASLYEQEKNYRQELRTKKASEVESPQEFIAGIYKASPFPVSEKKEAVGKFEDVVDAFEDWFKLSQDFPKFAIETRRRIDVLMDRHEKSELTLPGQTKEQADDFLFQKRAFNLGGMFGGAAAGKLVGGANKGKGDDKSDGNKDILMARLKLNDPDHDAELKQLEAEMALNSLIASDDVISSYTAEQVADAFAELDRSTPGITDNPLLMRANMRRQLQGDVTPFEADAAVQTSGKADKGERMRPLLSLSGEDSKK